MSEVLDDGSASVDPNASGAPIEDPNAVVDPNADPSPSDPGAADPNADPDAGQSKKQTAKDRIDELTRLRREAERDRDYFREMALRQPQQQVQQVATEEAPDPDKYEAGEFDTRYIKDVARWEAKQEVAEAMKAVKAEQQQSASDREWQSRIEKASETMPDFEEKVLVGGHRGDWACSQQMADALRASDKGPELAYNLASNPAEAARITRLPPALQLMELGKLEAKLTQPQPNTVTRAPEPAPQARGSGGQFKTLPDTSDFAAFDKTYGNG